MHVERAIHVNIRITKPRPHDDEAGTGQGKLKNPLMDRARR